MGLNSCTAAPAVRSQSLATSRAREMSRISSLRTQVAQLEPISGLGHEWDWERGILGRLDTRSVVKTYDK